ncbi:hypothetical protein [Halomicronema hongdechloris]|nr:hypothetical protein [Halomicronema hongdechloris]
MTLIGNREDCRVNQYQCTELEQSQLEERFSEVTTNWGKIPVSTAEVVIFFPAAIAFGFVSVAAQLQALMRLRRAVHRQIKSFSNQMDVTLIAPLLIDPKQSIVDQMAGGLTLLLPAIIFLYSVRLILIRLEILRNKLPYFQGARFYYFVYLLSAVLILFSLVRVGVRWHQDKYDRKCNQSDPTTMQ